MMPEDHPPERPAPPMLCWYEQYPDGVAIGAASVSANGFILLLGPLLTLGIVFLCILAFLDERHPERALEALLFGLISFAGTIYFGKEAMVALLGKVELSVNGPDVTLLEGLSPWVQLQHFALRDLREVREQTRSKPQETSSSLVLRVKDRALGSAREIQIGANLSDARRLFLKCALEHLIATTQQEVAAEKEAKAAKNAMKAQAVSQNEGRR